MNDQQADEVIYRSPWTLETRYTLKATRILQSIGREILVAYITVLLLGQMKALGKDNTEFNAEISFYAVRPRPAPFLGILGLFEPWSQKGLSELIVDGFFSFVTGMNVAKNYWGLVNHPPPNPAAPVGELKTLAVGAIMTCIPALVVLILTFLYSLGMAAGKESEDSDGKKKNREGSGLVGGCCIWAFNLCLVLVFIILIPLIALFEMIASAVLRIRRSRAEKRGDVAPQEEELEWMRTRSRWEEPLTTTKTWFRGLYMLFLLSSFIINIGNWLFFANYLKLSGELYCPSSVSAITAVWVLVPAGIDLLFWAFRAWTGDNWMGSSGLEPPPI